MNDQEEREQAVELEAVEPVAPVIERAATVREIVVRNQDDLNFLRNFAGALAESGYFTDARSPAQAAVKVLAGQELGIGPLSALMNIHIIDGKVALSANLMAAQIKRHPRYDYRVAEHTRTVCRVAFLERVDGAWIEVGTSEFTIEDATAASLGQSQSGKPSAWQKFPRNMLFARALSNGARWYAPDVFYGVPVYVQDELDATYEMTEDEARRYFNPDVSDDDGEPAAIEPTPTEVLVACPNCAELSDEDARRCVTCGGDRRVPAEWIEDTGEAVKPVQPVQLKRLGVLAGKLGFDDAARHTEAGLPADGSWNDLSYERAAEVINDWTMREREAKRANRSN